MTQPTDDFDDFTGPSAGAGEMFETRTHQDHLLIVKLWDEISPVITERCPTGYVTRNGKEWPNNALRASVVDLDMDADDGTRGRVYPGAIIFAGLLIKELKGSVGKTLLLIWRQKDPSDKSSPYSVWEMKHDANAVEIGRTWLNDHPEFKQIPAPPPWTAPRQEAPQDNGYRRDDRRDYRDPPPNNYGRDDRPPRYDDRRARDHGQHDGPYARDPWNDVDDARRRAEASRRDYRHDDRGGDGSFLSRSAESGRRGYQNEEPPF